MPLCEKPFGIASKHTLSAGSRHSGRCVSLPPQLPLFCAVARLTKAEHTKPGRADMSQRKLLWTLGNRSAVHSLRKLSLFIQFFSQIHFYTNINIYPDSPACSQRADNPECVSQLLSAPPSRRALISSSTPGKAYSSRKALFIYHPPRKAFQTLLPPPPIRSTLFLTLVLRPPSHERLATVCAHIVQGQWLTLLFLT